MKKILLLALLVGMMAGGLMAQSRIGGGFAYGTEVEEFGFTINGEFFLSNKVSLAPDLIYFFANDPLRWWELNTNVHYYFITSGAAGIYGLAGFNLATLDRKGRDNDAQTEFGLNVGLGANFDINSAVMPFVQLRGVFGDADQAVFSFGVRYTLN